MIVNTIALQHVKYMPSQLSEGTLYVSDEYALAGHLCACGCGTKVITPLGAAEWTYSERNGRPTLHPSIGNWQLYCKSHYFIREGQIHWAREWSDLEVVAGRAAEQERRQAYYRSIHLERSLWLQLWNWLRKLFA
jgi:hypothetical protein